jgi:hypothetical protein
LNSIEIIGWENAMAIVKALTNSNYEVLISSDEAISPWQEKRTEQVYHIEFSHREFEQGFIKQEDEQ